MNTMEIIKDEPFPYIGNASVWEYRNIEHSYGFERIDVIYWRDWVYHQWALAIYAALIYLVTIFGLQKHMKHRPAFDLKTLFILWNAGLGIFSIIGFIRSFSTMTRYFQEESGFYKSICVRGSQDVVMVFWGFAFGISKFVELGDTLFIVLRKRPLLLLQWYHHMVTLITVWITLPYAEPLGRLLVIMNYGVHSAMYPYFALKMAGVYVPKMIANVITTSQLTQMILGLLINILTIWYIVTGTPCFRPPISIYAYGLVYASFCVLFGKLFVTSVLHSGKRIKSE